MRRQTTVRVLQQVDDPLIELVALQRPDAEADVGNRCQQFLEQSREGGTGLEVLAVEPDVDAGERDLRVVRGEPPGLGDDLAGRPGAVTPAGDADDAIRAAQVASVLHLQPGACSARAAIENFGVRQPTGR